MRISRDDYNHATAASKPSSMTLRFLDKLFSKETLLRSTLYGTKEFAALDPSRIFAIKSKLSKQAITAIAIQLSLLHIVLLCHTITFINYLIYRCSYSFYNVYRSVFSYIVFCEVELTKQNKLINKKSTKITVKLTTLPMQFPFILKQLSSLPRLLNVSLTHRSPSFYFS